MIAKYSSLMASMALLTATSVLAADALPQFTVAYFNGACPAGWDSANLASANGRFLAPTMPGGGAGSYGGQALASQQPPVHKHAKATGSVTTSSKEYILVGGCCNNTPGDSGTYTMTGSAASAESALPYIQFNACMKQENPGPMMEVPKGLATFNLMPSCPKGWSPFNSAAGRYIVGLPANGVPGAAFGGRALTAGENRTHSHSMNGVINFPTNGIAGGSGCCAHGYAGSGNTNFSGNTEADITVPYDSAVQAPYYTATFCRKD